MLVICTAVDEEPLPSQATRIDEFNVRPNNLRCFMGSLLFLFFPSFQTVGTSLFQLSMFLFGY